MDLITILNLLLLAFLIFATGFFVAAEFAVVKLRMSRIDQLIDEGNKKAMTVKRVADNLDYNLSACQLGITVTALGLGSLGKPTVEKILYPVFDWLNLSQSLSSVLSYAIAFILVTILHVVVGEMAPKTLAIQFAEKMSLLLAPPLYWFGKIMFPFIWLLNGTSRVILRMFGVPAKAKEDSYTEEELKIVMTQSYKGGEINQTELEYMENIFSFDERVAKDIMVPRINMAVFEQNMTREEIAQMMIEHHFTRYPVIEDTKDQVIGIVNVKKMLTKMAGKREYHLADFIQPIPFILETTKIYDAFIKMQKIGVHMAIVVDEYGGTSGLLTIEDILEEIVGEIRDEFDEEEVEEIEYRAPNKYCISGRVLLADLEEKFGMTFANSDQIDTLGGWIHQKLAGMAKKGDVVEENGLTWTVMKVKQLQIQRVQLEGLHIGGEPKGD
ncbi:hemolysin family protein [Cytobacillus sp. FSL R7-0696]|uniref:hemolysin family protein n=1 Tax=Cytobacillus sp. FSL R7-0696 TaxID=2921691 RepID=UPI0030FB71B1